MLVPTRLLTPFFLVLTTAFSVLFSAPAFATPIDACTPYELSNEQKESILSATPAIDLKNGANSWAIFRSSSPSYLYFAYDTDNLVAFNNYPGAPSTYIGAGSSTTHFIEINTSTNDLTFFSGAFGEREITCLQGAFNVALNDSGSWSYPTYPYDNTWLDIAPPAPPSTALVRDTSNISLTGECYMIADEKTLYVYEAGNRNKYTLVSDKYYLSETTSETIPPEANCVSLATIQEIPSYYDFMTPIFHFIAILSMVSITYIAYRLIIYPFYRKGV